MDTSTTLAQRSDATSGVQALLVDGTVVTIRPPSPRDADALRTLHHGVSQQSLLFRFFSVSPRSADQYVGKLTRPAAEDHAGLLVELGGRVIAVGGYERIADSGTAEIAFLVEDRHHGLGVGTLLLEHLADTAADHGISRFVAETLVANSRMLGVFRDAGYDVRTRLDGGVVHVELPLRETPRLRQAVADREATAAHRSLRHLLAPASIAVVGAGHRPGGLGNELLHHLRTGGFTGPLYAVNRSGSDVHGVRAYRSVTDIPDPVELAVLAVPADQVLTVAAQCADREVRGLVVITAGFAESTGGARQRELLQLCRRAGIRLVGPNCLGVLNTAPDVSMNATLSDLLPPAGSVGLASQSGAVGIAALDHAARTHVGISTFVSLGNKADVSGNDVLQFWEHDDTTRVCALYLESFGNPRKFSRIARRVARRKPVVAITAGRSMAGERGTRSHTAAAATPTVAVDALFRQAGVIRASTLGELFDIVSLLDLAPLPAGGRVAVVGNSGGPGVLAADAAEAAGLELPELPAETQDRLAAMLPTGAAVANPVDLTAAADAVVTGRVVRSLISEPGIDAVVVIYTPLRSGATEAIAQALTTVVTENRHKPVVAAFLGSVEPPRAAMDPSGRPCYPVFPWPESAVNALAAVAGYSRWRHRAPDEPPELSGTDAPAARALVEAALRESPAGRWLDAEAAVQLVSCFGIRCAPTVRAADADAAAAVAASMGGPVVLKAAAGDLVHKTDLGAVALDLTNPRAVRAAFRRMASRLGRRMGGAVLQPMAGDGVEAALGVVHDPAFGPLVMVGLGGVATDLVADRSFCLTPLGRQDAAAAVRSLRSAPLLFGYRGSPARDVAGLEDMLCRLAALADAVPEIAELDINPVLVGTTESTALDVKVRVAPYQETHALRRQLRDAT